MCCDLNLLCTMRLNAAEGAYLIRLEELEQARKEIDKTNGEKPMKQIMFKAI